MNLKFETLERAQRKRILRVVSSGGGAKGIVYPGSYKAMIDTGIYDGIKTFAGASAGAISSAFMAVGMPPPILRDHLLSTNLKDLLGTNVSKVLGRNGPGVSLITRDGKPLETFLRTHLTETVRKALKKLKHLSELAKKHSELQQLINKINIDNPQITFADLALLNRFFPKHFKQLVVTAIKFPSGEIQIFNSSKTPQVEIALACRASASIPVIMQPVEIEIDGIKHQFADGGLYDNLPTDYFDTDSDGNFIKNQIPTQTLVFAFGDGLNNKKNQVFQALYGEQWDSVISEETLVHLLKSAMELNQKQLRFEQGLVASEEEMTLLCDTVQSILKQHVKDKLISKEESRIIIMAMKKSFNSLSKKAQKNKQFWEAYEETNNETERIQFLVRSIKEKMKPLLYDAGIFEKFKRNVLVELLGDMEAPYKNTIQKEISYQKLRSEYALRTVELRVGSIKTTDFSEATKSARVLASLGYLDTINHLTNHDLHREDRFNAEQFFIDLVHHFEHIYCAVLWGSGKHPDKNPLLHSIAQFRNELEMREAPEEVISRQIYQLLKDIVEQQIDGVEAFALSRAVEFHNNEITSEALFKETYEEGFKRSSSYSMSNIAGECIFRPKTLHESLKDKDMFLLYKNQSLHHQETRTDKIFESLNNIEGFAKATQPSLGTNTDSLMFFH